VSRRIDTQHGTQQRCNIHNVYKLASSVAILFISNSNSASVYELTLSEIIYMLEKQMTKSRQDVQL